MSDAYVARLRNFYALHDPDKIHSIPSLIQSFPDEEKLFRILVSRYGPEPMSPRSTSSRIWPRSQSNNNLNLLNASVSSSSPLQLPNVDSNMSITSSPPDLLSSSSLTVPLTAIEGPTTAPYDESLILPLVMQHLRSSKYTEAAQCLERECAMLELKYDLAPDLLPSEAATSSVLAKLLSPPPSTQHALATLLRDVPRRLAQHLPRQYDSAALEGLVRMAVTPMWSVIDDAVHPVPTAESDMSSEAEKLHALSLNKLVERCTEVHIQPHVTVSAQKVEGDIALVERVLRWHRHVTHPHALLAKLIQRSLVPWSLPLHDTFRGYSIRIENRGVPIERLKYVDKARHIITVRVLAMIYTWITQLPCDWDEVMVQSLLLYLEDYGMTGSQHIQLTESIKLSLSTLEVRRCDVPFTSNYKYNGGYRLERQPVVPRTMPAEQMPASITAVDPIRVARQITARDHVLLRRALPMELVAHVFGCNTFEAVTRANPAHNLGAVFKAYANLFYFSVHEVVGRGVGGPSNDDSADGGKNDVAHRVERCAYLCRLVHSLLQCNNLNAASAIATAFRHPAVARLTSTLTAFKRDHPDLEEMLVKFTNTIVRSLPTYHEYLEGLSSDDVAAFPPIPIVGTGVRELRYIEYSEPVVMTDDRHGYLLHWRKFSVMDEALEMLRKYQDMTVPSSVLSVLPGFQFWLENLFEKIPHSDEHMYALSRKAEA
eukprot:PhM_4_TR6167/c0_g1_i1/m.104908